MQFTRIKTEAIDILLNCSKHKKSVKRSYNKRYCRKNSPNNSKRKRQMYSETFGTPPHDRPKDNIRLCNYQVYVQTQVDQAKDTTHQYANMKSRRKVRKLFFNAKMTPAIVVDFKNQTKEGPFYICVICNHHFHKMSVILYRVQFSKQK